MTQEREALAQCLHDELGGTLVQLRLAYASWRDTQATGTSTGPGPIFEGLLAELSTRVRRLTLAMAPPQWHDDLLPALESVAAELALRSGLTVQLDAAALREPGAASLPVDLRVVACRIVRELGLNVQKHAQARELQLQASVAGGQLRVAVRDDGVGLSEQHAEGLGLRSARAQLRALGGSLTLHARDGGGTCATLCLPLPALPHVRRRSTIQPAGVRS